MNIEIGQIWKCGNGDIVEIIEYEQYSGWPWVAKSLKFPSTELSFTHGGVYSPNGVKSDKDLAILLSKEENPEYFL